MEIENIVNKIFDNEVGSINTLQEIYPEHLVNEFDIFQVEIKQSSGQSPIDVFVKEIKKKTWRELSLIL
jgi:hypothetical protein